MGVYMSCSQVWWIFYTEPWHLPKTADGAHPLYDITLNILTPPCQLLENFRSWDDISYSCLFNDAPPINLPQKENKQQGEMSLIFLCHKWFHCLSLNYFCLSFADANLIMNQVTSVLITETMVQPHTDGAIINELASTDFSEMQMDTELQWHEYNMEADQHLLVGWAWIYVEDQRWLCLFPKVMHVGAMSHTNNKKMILLTFSGCTSEGQTFIFLSMFLPNQKAYSFRWVF
jgi:hypothetical protein